MPETNDPDREQPSNQHEPQTDRERLAEADKIRSQRARALALPRTGAVAVENDQFDAWVDRVHTVTVPSPDDERDGDAQTGKRLPDGFPRPYEPGGLPEGWQWMVALPGAFSHAVKTPVGVGVWWSTSAGMPDRP